MKPADLSDPRELAVYNKIEGIWMGRKGPRVGDYVQMPNGEYRRFTHDWKDDIQTTTCGNAYGCSFNIDGGYASYSGGLDPGLSKAKLTDTGKVKPGMFWFFHHGQAGAHRGVSCELPCRIFKYDDPDWKCRATTVSDEADRQKAIKAHAELNGGGWA